MAYGDFAYYYDTLMEDADYPARTEYLLKLFKKFDKTPSLLLDVACGTGGFSKEFAGRGVEVIGTDMSEDMLAVARETTAQAELDVLYLCQRAEELDLYGTVDGAICCMDSINHITDKRTLATAFKKISLFLEPERLFIFDVNTLYKQENILGNNTFVLENDSVFCVWQNEFDKRKKETHIFLDFFQRQEEKYERKSENFYERVYSDAELEKMLNSAGFKVESVFGDMTLKAPKSDCQRKFFVCRKVK